MACILEKKQPVELNVVSSAGCPNHLAWPGATEGPVGLLLKHREASSSARCSGGQQACGQGPQAVW